MRAPLLLFLAVTLFARPTCASEIAIALTDNVVEVDAGFSGAEIVLFGALVGEEALALQGAGAVDIVAVLRGPETTFRVRPMQRERGIWMAGPAIDIKAPGIFHAASTRPLDDIAAAETWRALRAFADPVLLSAAAAPEDDDGAAFIAEAGMAAPVSALKNEATAAGRFRETAGAVEFRRNALFSIRLNLPPATPVGDYEVEVFLMRNGAPVSRDETSLTVRKVGVERRIYDLANEKPVSYGVACVLIALLAGWLAAAAFRKS